jgi:hypothetical protein
MSMLMLHVIVHAACHVHDVCSYPCCISMSVLHVHVNSATCPNLHAAFPCCMFMLQVHSTCPCQCCMYMSMLQQVIARAARPYQCCSMFRSPCCMSMVHVHAIFLLHAHALCSCSEWTSNETAVEHPNCYSPCSG